MEITDGQDTEVNDTPIDNEEGEGVIEPTETGEVDELEERPKETPEEDKPDGVQKKINKIHREKKEAEEKADAERQKREKLEEELKKYQKTELPDIPEIPDYLGDDYEKKMVERDEIIKQHAHEASRKEALANQQAAETAAKNEAKQKEVEGYIKAFDSRIDELNLDRETVIKAENIVGKYIGHQPELSEYLVSDSENGPLNVQYLSQNLDELEKISKMSSTNAAVYIATKITPAAQELKPKQTKAPEVPYDPEGNKREVDNDPVLAGATFE